MSVIGSAYVNIRAITDKLESDIRDALNKIQDSISISVNADTSAATSQIQAVIEEVPDRLNIDIDANTAAATAQIQEVVAEVPDRLDINVDADTTAATERIAAVEGGDATINVHADTGEAEAEVSALSSRISRLRASILATVQTTIARVQLAALTRRRYMSVDVGISAASVARFKATTAMMGRQVASLSGGRVLTDRIKKMVNEFERLDRMVPGISRISLILGSLAGIILNSTAGLLTLGAALGSIINMMGLVAPGMLAGFATGIGTLMVALSDFKKQLPDVVEQYKTLGQAIKVPFWDIAREPIRDMANTLFPSLRDGLENTAISLGKWTSELARSVKVSFTADRIGTMFGFLTKSIDIASDATSKNIQTLSTLGIAGGSVLPRLAGWWVDVSTQFNNFIETAAADGRLTMWIDTGIQNLKELGGVVGALGGIFANLTEAAQAAGSDGLTNLLEGLKVFKEITDDAGVQGNLTTIFEGAAIASDGLVEALARVFGGIGDMAPAIKSAFGSVSVMLTELATAIQGVLQNDEFQAGFVAMFAGLQAGFEALMPVIATTGPKFGEIAQVIGLLAANLGGVLGAALEITLPLIIALGEAVKPLIAVLGDSLITILETLAPTFAVLTKTISDLSPVITVIVTAVAELVVWLVDKLEPILPGLIVGFGTFFGILLASSAVSGAVGTMKALAAGTALASNATKLATGIQFAFNLVMAANPVTLVIAGIVALIAVVVLAYNNIGWFKDFVDGAFKFIGDVIANVVNWVKDNWKMLLGFLTGPIGMAVIFIIDNWSQISDMFTTFFSNTVGMFVDFFTNTVGMFSDFFGNVGRFFSDIGDGISDAFSAVSTYVSDAINKVSLVIGAVLDAIVLIWKTGWNLIADTFKTIWTNLTDFFRPLIEFYAAIITGVIDIVTAVWQVGWEIVSTIFIGVWTNLVRFFTPIIQGIQDTISIVVEATKIIWETVWQAVSDFFTTIWNNIVAFVVPIVQSIHDAISLTVTVISAMWNAMWQAIGDFFMTIWNNIVAFITPIIQGISDTINTTLQAINVVWGVIWGGIRDFFTGMWNGLVAFITPIILGIQSTIGGALNTISSTWNSIWSGISSFFTSIWNNIVSAATGFVDNIRNKVSEAANFFTSLPGDILAKVSNFGSLLYNAGSDLLKGLANGITDMSAWVVDKVKGVGSSIVDGLKNFFGIQSPSKVMREQIGLMIGAGLAQGIEQSVGMVSKATDKLMEAATPQLPELGFPTNNAPALTTSSLRPTRSSSANPVDDVLGGSGNFTGAGVNVIINPSTGLDETQIGRIAVNELLWQINNR